MRKTTFSAGIFLLGLAAAAPAQTDLCSSDLPPVRAIDRTCLPAPAAKTQIALYNTDLAEHYQEIATVDSFLSDNKCEDTTRAQLKDLQAKGEGLNADALIRVRMLSNRAQGWKENNETPFFSVKQGQSNDYFFRATAIKYLRLPAGAPTQVAVPVPRADVVTVSPLIDTNELLKLNNNKTRRHEMTIPEVYTTNQP